MTRHRLVAIDVLVALVLAGPAAVVLLRDLGATPTAWALAGATVLWSGSLALRSTDPLAMAAVASAGVAAFVLVPGQHSQEPFISTLVIIFCVGAQLAGRRFRTAVALLAVTTVPMNFDDTAGRSTLNLVITPFVLLGGPILAGVALRRSRAQGTRLRELSAALVAERELHARTAAAAERNRIARDLHDVISHSVTAMMVQAGAAEAQIAPDSPARAQVAAVRRTGRETLTELRRQLGVLRETSPT